MRNRPTGTPAGRPSFEEACRMYVHRYTGQHVPAWATSSPSDHGGTERRFYAPHFLTDREWYEHTIFPGEPAHQVYGFRDCCFTSGQTWPYGQWLDEPFRRDDPPKLPEPGPRVSVILEAKGNGEGIEVTGLAEAARAAATWIRGIDPSEVGTDFRVSIEILDPEDS